MRADVSVYRAMRVRVTAAATALVLVVLAVTAFAVITAHRGVLVGNLDETLEQASAELVDTYRAGERSPDVAGFGDDDAAFQLLDGGGRVVAATANLSGGADDAPIAPAPTGAPAVIRTVRGLPHDDAEFRVRSERVQVGDDELVVHVAAPLDDIQESAAALGAALLAAVPATTTVLAVALWFLVGRLLRQAEAAARRQERFVADASHELRGPLTRIRTELEVDLSHPDRADAAATHRVVLAEALRLQRLVDDLLELARVDGSGEPARPSAMVDLDLVVGQVGRDLRAIGGLTIDTSAVLPVQVRGDADQLRRLVSNLADNAARHATDLVRFELAPVDGEAVLAVVDDGPGIPDGEQERVFERFSRVDQARGSGSGGTGLGLAIAREIVLRHGGTVGVDPVYGPGARLVVRLPAAAG